VYARSQHISRDMWLETCPDTGERPTFPDMHKTSLQNITSPLRTHIALSISNIREAVIASEVFPNFFSLVSNTTKSFLEFCQPVKVFSPITSVFFYKFCYLWYNNNNNSIQFVYLRANLTAQRPITKLARRDRSTQNS
jgi:hypothetical protein